MIFGSKHNVRLCADDGEVSLSDRRLTDLVTASIERYGPVTNEEIEEASEHLSYKCDSNRCDFSPVLNKILASSSAESKGVREIAAAVVCGLEHVPTAVTTSGYIIKRAGASIIYISNDSLPSPKDNDLTGFIDASQLRRRFALKHHQQMESRRRMQTVSMGVIGGTGLALLCMKVIKKI